MSTETRSLGLLFAVSAVLPLLAAASALAQTQPQAQPVGMVGVGKSPFALAVPSNQQAVVVNLFPEGPASTNTKLVDLNARTVTSQLRVGTRLVAVAVAGTRALVVNEDQDFVIVVDLTTARELTRISVGSRPSNVIVANTQTAIATNGTSGDLSFINLQTNTVSGTPVKVGKDPRAVAVHPSGAYAYVALGGDNAVAVIDLKSNAVVKTVNVGKNPSAIAVTRDGRRAVVTNLTSNTVSVLNVESPASPTIVPTSSGTQIPVGVQPTALEIHPSNKVAYVANLGSNFFTAVDLDKMAVAGVVNVQRPDPANPTQKISSPTSGIRITPDATRLLVTEFRDDSMLLIYDLNNMPLSPAPAMDVPGEPHASMYFDVNPSLGCPGYYTAVVSLADGAQPGFWGMQVLTTAGQRLLQGGFNLGGAFDANGGNPGFGAFNIANAANEPQTVKITVLAQALPTTGFSAANLGLSVQLLQQQPDGSRTPVGQAVSGPPPLTMSSTVNPGFYVVNITSLAGSPRGTFQMSMETAFTNRPGGAFQGGVVVGGYAARDASGNSTQGFGGFCISDGQTINISTFGAPTYGDAGAGDLVLALKDRDGKVIRSINNSLPTSGGVTLPAAPSMQGVVPTIYVDAAAAAGGDGSQARPLRSITAAVSKARSGDVILVKPGAYSPSKTGEVIPIGSPGPNINPLQANVKIFGSGAATTILDAEQAAGSAGNANAFVIAANNVRFAGFTVRGSQQFGILVYQASGVVLDSNFCTSNGRDGIGAISSPGLVVTGNVAAANQETGIVVSGSTTGAASSTPTGCPSAFGACIINNTANDNRSDGILASQGGNVYILSNTTLNNGSSGIELNNRADTGQSPPLTGYIRNNIVSNNGGVQFAFAGTGILVTEDANAAEISGNQLANNRPYGIGIFLNGTAGLISKNQVTATQYNGILVRSTSAVSETSDNTVTASGLSGLFVDDKSRVDRVLRNSSTDNGTNTASSDSKSGLAVLGGSRVGTVDANFFDRNSAGMEMAGASTVSSVTNSTFNNNDSGGALVRDGSTLSAFSNNQVRNNRGQGGIMVGSATASLSNSDISANAGAGVTLFAAAKATIQSCQINANVGGILAFDGSTATVSGTTLNGNKDQAILAAGAGAAVTLAGNNLITNTQGWGLNVQGGSISCTGTNTISGSSSGNILGNATGCQ
jgi:YVTN family beta-propeller protein